MQEPRPPLRVCAYEDRAEAMDSLILMAESLCAADREIELHLMVPEAPEKVRALARRWPQVFLSTARPEGVSGWDVKPWLLLKHLDEGVSSVLWLDDDIIVTRPISQVVRQFPPGSLIFAEEWGRWTVRVSELWGMPSARPVPLFNNCFIHVAQAHRRLMERWLEMTRDPRYRAAQALPYAERPQQAKHDGWLLIALLESEEFGAMPYECIRNGDHIAQCAGSSGYRPGNRLRDLFRGLPPMIHGLGRKPWDIRREPRLVQRYLLDFATDVSPYVLAARPVAKRLNMPLRWTEPRTLPGVLARALAGNHPGLAGLPMASLHALYLGLRRSMGSEE